jgi:hypothetical protein
MSPAAALLDSLGRPGDVRLGTTHGDATPRLSTGLRALDDTLGGGLPRGRVTEVVGPRSAGRTGIACAVAASATGRGETIAWVDPEDALEPEAAAAAGIVLGRTLWVRPRGVLDALRSTAILLGAGGFGLVVLDVGSAPNEVATGAWAKLAHAAERSRSSLLVLAARREPASVAAVGLEVTGRRVRWSGGAGRLLLLDGIEARVTVSRSRIGRTGQGLVLGRARG